MPNNTKPQKILIIGSGPIVIGQAAEFDYSGTQACVAAREERVETILVNSNPATIQTDPDIADKVYIEPLDPIFLEKILDKERPDGVLATAGGQTGLNVGSKLYEMGILEKYNVQFLGTDYESIQKGEDRGMFKDLMTEIGQPVLPAKSVKSVEEGVEFARSIEYPVILRVAFTLGGTGGNTAFDEEDLRQKLDYAIKASPVGQVLLEKSILGWVELEYEMIRDSVGNKICICNMENIDAMGVHTGESMVIAPSQTLSDQDHQMLRTAALDIVEALNIQGGCNVQFALNRFTGEYYVIEVNPRLSRSSALASKATGYPIARVHTKIALGKTLPEITNDITGNTAFFEPALDYVVIKIPRWPDDKFPEMNKQLGVSMKSTGEVMAIGRNFEEAMYKAIVSLDAKNTPLTPLDRGEKIPPQPPLKGGSSTAPAKASTPQEGNFYQTLGFNPVAEALVQRENVVSREESWPDEKIEIGTAHGWIYNPKLNKFLVTRPYHRQKQFLLPGGVVESDDFVDGWFREVQEETGLMPTDLREVVPIAHTTKIEKSSVKQENLVESGLLYFALTDKEEILGSHEAEVLWLTKEEILNEWTDFYPSIKEFSQWFLRNYEQILEEMDQAKLQSWYEAQQAGLPKIEEQIKRELNAKKSPFPNLQAVTFDIDGVMTDAFRLENALIKAGLDKSKIDAFITDFFKSEGFRESMIGLADIKYVLPTYLKNLGWSRSTEEFLTFWFEADSRHIEQNMLVAQFLQKAGVPVYAATNQEAHRLKYLKKEQFSLRNSEYASKFSFTFEGWFSSCRLGYLKKDSEYFPKMARLGRFDLAKVVHIDDSVEVVENAQKAGFQAIHYKSGDNLLAKILPYLGINLTPHTQRLKHVFQAFDLGLFVDQIVELTHFHPWFVHKLKNLYENHEQVAQKINTYKMVDTCAGEFEAKTPYFYSTHGSETEATEKLYYQFEPNFDYLIDRAKKDGRELVLDVLIFNEENKVFVQKRRKERKFLPNCWGIVGGHLRGDNSVKSGLNRILQEETGWELKRIVSLIETRDWEFQGVKKRTLVFDVEVDGDLNMPRLQLDKVSGFLWISKTELPLFYENQDYNEQLMYKVCKKGLEMHNEPRKVIILGSGPIRIGQGVEFDYLTVHAVQALQKKGIKAIIINNNPETVSTDYSTSDRLYFEPLTPEFVQKVIDNEKDGLLGVIAQFGGQTAIKLAEPLEQSGTKILGTSSSAIDLAEDREKTGDIVQGLGYKMPDWRIAWSREEVLQKVEEIGYPVLLRPSFVLGGEGMKTVYSREEVLEYLEQHLPQGTLTFTKPLLIDKFIDGAIEVDVDFISDGEKTYCFILEQLDKAGTHSGDSACVFPAQNLGREIQDRLVQITREISKAFGVIGIGNLQCAIKDGEIFVLEVNPRASRTVPFVSKCLGFSLTELATNVILGDKLPEFDFDLDYYKHPEYAWSLKQEVVYKEQPIKSIAPKFVAIKWPVFCLEKLIGVNPELGPLMKSTGEAMTVGKTFEEAYKKWKDPQDLDKVEVYSL